MRYAVLAIIAMIAPSFSGCLSQEPPSLGSSSDPAERLSIWRRCLETSYAEARKKSRRRERRRRLRLPELSVPRMAGRNICFARGGHARGFRASQNKLEACFGSDGTDLIFMRQHP